MDRQTIQTYNLLAKEYDDETKDFWERFPSNIIKKFAKSINDGFVLDIGSGPGRDGLILKKAGLDVICLDASKPMVNLSISKGLPSVLGNFMDLPFSDNSFSGVWAYTSLLHIPKNKITKALKEIHRALKPNGIFGLGLIEGTEEEYRLSSGVDKPRYFAFYSREEIEILLDKNGFSIFYFDQFQPKSKNYLNFLARKI